MLCATHFPLFDSSNELPACTTQHHSINSGRPPNFYWSLSLLLGLQNTRDLLMCLLKSKRKKPIQASSLFFPSWSSSLSQTILADESGKDFWPVDSYVSNSDVDWVELCHSCSSSYDLHYLALFWTPTPKHSVLCHKFCFSVGVIHSSNVCFSKVNFRNLSQCINTETTWIRQLGSFCMLHNMRHNKLKESWNFQGWLKIARTNVFLPIDGRICMQ